MPNKISFGSRLRLGIKLFNQSLFGLPLSSGAYDGASARRRLAGWQPTDASMQSIVASDARMLRRRSRDLHRNNGYVASARDTFVSDLVGTGIKPSPILDDEDQRKEIKILWKDWCDEADADHLLDFYGLEALVAGAMFESGECFIRFRERDPEDGFVVPLQIQILESDMCPIEYNTTTASGNIIINGIEFDLIGRRVAYWMYRRHPGDQIVSFNNNSFVPVRVPAYQILHVFRPLRPGQVRGVPWTSPSMVRLWLIDQYDDAELDRKKTAAMYAGFIEAPVAEQVIPELDTSGQPPGSADLSLEPGTIQGLAPGEKITWSEPADVGGSYEPFQYRNLLAAASGMTASYLDMTGDLRRANYSTLRGAIIRVRRKIEMHQQNLLIRQMCRAVRMRWMDDAVLSGMISFDDYLTYRRVYQRALWITPRQDWVDPQKDMSAEKIAVDGLFKARSDVIESMGHDPDEVDARILVDQKREDELGLRRGAGSTTTATPDAQDIADAVGDQTSGDYG